MLFSLVDDFKNLHKQLEHIEAERKFLETRNDEMSICMREALKKQTEAEESKLQLESNLKNIQKTLEETLNSKAHIETQAISKENFMNAQIFEFETRLQEAQNRTNMVKTECEEKLKSQENVFFVQIRGLEERNIIAKQNFETKLQEYDQGFGKKARGGERRKAITNNEIKVFQTKFEELEKEIRDKNQKIGEFEKEIKHFKNYSLTDQVKRKIDEVNLDKLKEELNEERKQKCNLEFENRRLSNLNAKLQTYNRKIANDYENVGKQLKEKKEKFEKELEKHTAENQRLETQLQYLGNLEAENSKLNEIQLENEKLKSEFESMKKRFEFIKEQKNKLEEFLDKTSPEMSSLNEQKLEEKILILKEEKSKLEERLKQLEDEKCFLEVDLKEARAKYKEFEDTLNQAKNDCPNYECHLTIENLNDEVKKLKLKISDLIEDNERLKQDVENLEKNSDEYEELLESCRSLENRICSTEKELENRRHTQNLDLKKDIKSGMDIEEKIMAHETYVENFYTNNPNACRKCSEIIEEFPQKVEHTISNHMSENLSDYNSIIAELLVCFPAAQDKVLEKRHQSTLYGTLLLNRTEPDTQAQIDESDIWVVPHEHQSRNSGQQSSQERGNLKRHYSSTNENFREQTVNPKSGQYFLNRTN
uniref:Uncharacterized protein n=1 Tax=Acrobeloides nanus TaxID=290746 RepID=A0A914EEX4_9BILA